MSCAYDPVYSTAAPTAIGLGCKQFGTILGQSELFLGAKQGGAEVLGGWRTLGLPIMPPDPVSWHAFVHTQPG